MIVSRTPLEVIEKGISNTRWQVFTLIPENASHVIGDYRDRYGTRIRFYVSFPNEHLEDLSLSGYLSDVLLSMWQEFKRGLERRYNEPQEWETCNLGVRAQDWFYNHPGAWIRYHPDHWEAESEPDSK